MWAGFAAKKTEMRAVSVEQVLAERLGETWFLEPHGAQIAMLDHWLKEHNAHYYSRPAHAFSEDAAIAEARAHGYWCVLVENLG